MRNCSVGGRRIENFPVETFQKSIAGCMNILQANVMLIWLVFSWWVLYSKRDWFISFSLTTWTIFYLILVYRYIGYLNSISLHRFAVWILTRYHHNYSRQRARILTSDWTDVELHSGLKLSHKVYGTMNTDYRPKAKSNCRLILNI
jgi:hypothetical protein